MKSWLAEPLKVITVAPTVDEDELLLDDDMLFVVAEYRLASFFLRDLIKNTVD